MPIILKRFVEQKLPHLAGAISEENVLPGAIPSPRIRYRQDRSYLELSTGTLLSADYKPSRA